MVARDLPPEARVTKLDMAQGRFAKALDALEAAVLPLAEARGRADRDASEIARLKEERDRLLARVAELEDETRSLAGLTEEVEGRLDGAIAEIRSALGR
jgi:chromosome segregation ATPase